MHVLNDMLQDGKQLPAWHPRVCRVLYVGMSQQYLTIHTVGQVQNLTAGHILDQYHYLQ
jgi:hypothetical protein